jgi:glycosyltransferase involved in cell wall biosynthesis
MIDEQVKPAPSQNAGNFGRGDDFASGQSGANEQPSQDVRLATGTKLLFVVTEDWYFVSHRLPLAVAAVAAGMDVSLATNVSSHAAAIRQAGITLYPWKLNRGSTGLIAEFKALCGLLRIYWRVRPDIVHQVAIKPVLYGSLLAKLLRIPRVVNALGGMGAIFSDTSGKRGRLRAVVLAGFRSLLNRRGSLLILQNPDDCELMVNGAAIARANIRLIRGAGVDVRVFDVVPEPQGVPMVVLPARMLTDKGVVEFVEAAKLLKAQGVQARFVLVGGTDECNPASVPPATLKAWVDSGAVEWHGRRDDMPLVYRSASLVCLPSYREGLPKALLEAAACGRAIVATDVPGCREIVRHGENGLLVKVRDVNALAQAMATLLDDTAMRHTMGAAGRKMVLQEFSEEKVVADTLAIYQELMAVAD